MITQAYDLNLIPGGVPVRVPVSQYDAGSRDITFNLYSGSAAFSVPAGATVTVDGTKPDRKGFSYIAAASGNTVTVTITKQMTAVPGNTECQLTVMQSGKVLGSANFLLTVERAALPNESDLSETEISAIETWKNQSLTAAENAEKSRAAAAASATAAANSEDAAQGWAENASNHTHSAGNITSGTLSTARLPTVPVSKGGLAKTSWTAYRLLYPSSSTAFTQLSHPTAAGSFLRQNTSGAPYWTAPAELRSAIEAAPSGYGLGVIPYMIDNMSTAILPGWYYSKSTSDAGAPLIGAGKTVLLVERTADMVKQTASYIDDGALYTAVRTITVRDGYNTVSDWEWINPPMNAGVEYKTTERWRKKTVYTTIVDIGSLPNTTTKTVTSSIAAGATACIRCSGEANGLALPYAFGMARIDLGCVGGEIRVSTNFDATAFSAHVQIWYIKD